MIRMVWVPLLLVVLFTASPCLAQQPGAEPRRDREPRAAGSEATSSGTVTPTPEMWFYDQELRRHDDAKMAVRRRAEARAQARHDRLAAQQWYGIDNSRPTVSLTPLCGGYSAYWGSNSFDPLRWRPITPTIIVARPTNGPY